MSDPLDRFNGAYKKCIWLILYIGDHIEEVMNAVTYGDVRHPYLFIHELFPWCQSATPCMGCPIVDPFIRLGIRDPTSRQDTTRFHEKDLSQ